MAKRDELLRLLNSWLRPETFHDSCPNGLQVHGDPDVWRVATCPSVSEECFRQAATQGAQMILVHHGLFWDRPGFVVDEVMRRRLWLLFERGINLVGYHLPLDAHPELGNNARLAGEMGLAELDFDFGLYHGNPIGCVGALPQGPRLEELAARLGAALLCTPYVQGEPTRRVQKVAVIAGGAGDIPFLLDARARGCEVFVTGNVFEQSVAVARELDLALIALGHYNSEKLGVRALGDRLAAQSDVTVFHLDVPNPI